MHGGKQQVQGVVGAKLFRIDHQIVYSRISYVMVEVTLEKVIAQLVQALDVGASLARRQITPISDPTDSFRKRCDDPHGKAGLPGKHKSRSPADNHDLSLLCRCYKEAMEPMHIRKLAEAVAFDPAIEQVCQPVDFLLVDDV